ncbi:acyltransferase family protein [Novosphingobium sp. FSY-8]|uniref:Acyltransferase family protein n=1 Tax=Novosphingobium ovatum TaxID=1908523 RepID=A0ABW9XCP9_9SPHN|nr:acyltransferase [Novosphingobium ovatum]NBC36321.1 acyltransferase family protein [Novosphingobium ovatum]
MSDTPSPAPRPQRLPGLEVLRLIAASCVLFLHALANFGATSGITLTAANGTPFDAARLFGRGYLGVDFFLMLSGFLMATVQEPRLSTGLSPWRFMGKRYWRLWPMMALGGLIGLPRLFIRAPDWWDATWVAAANLLLIPVPWHSFVFPLNVPAWTIACELICNALHVTLLWRIRGGWLWLALAALLPVQLWIGAHWQYYNVGAQPANFLPGVARCLFAYMLGMGLARWWRAGTPIPMPWWLALPLMPLVLALAHWGQWRGWGYELGFTLVICPLMIAGAMRLNRFHGAAAWAGRLSFPLFALQMPILEGMRMLHSSYWVAIGLAYGVSVAAMAGSYALSKWLDNRRMVTSM